MMNTLAAVIAADAAGYEHAFQYLDALGAQGGFFSEYDDSLSSAQVKKLIRLLASQHIDKKDPWMGCTVIFLGKLAPSVHPKELMREVMLEFMVWSARLPFWFAAANSTSSNSSKIHLFFPSRDITGKPFLLSQNEVDLLHTFAFLHAQGKESTDGISTHT